MTPLPLPIRIAAGLVATAVEQVRELPRTIVELPVTAVSQTLQATMRVQQRVTELAIKGDRALSVLRPVEEKPSWATFDDEDDLPVRTSSNGASVTALRPVPVSPAPVSAEPPSAETLSPAAAMAEVAAAPGSTVDEPRFDAEALALIDDAEDDEGGVTELAEPAAEGLPPLPIPDYPTMTIAQLRGRLRYLSVADLEQLLAFETSHEDRPPYVTMLGNRITTVTRQ